MTASTCTHFADTLTLGEYIFVCPGEPFSDFWNEVVKFFKYSPRRCLSEYVFTMPDYSTICAVFIILQKNRNAKDSTLEFLPAPGTNENMMFLVLKFSWRLPKSLIWGQHTKFYLGNHWYDCSGLWMMPPFGLTPWYFSFIFDLSLVLHLLKILVITARKRSLQRLCFYTCLSVILFTGRGVHGRRRAWVGVCVGRGGHAWQGGMCGRGVCMAGGMYGRGACVAGGQAWQGGVHGRGCMGVHGREPPDTVRYGRSMRGRYASYWNAFLLT